MLDSESLTGRVGRHQEVPASIERGFRIALRVRSAMQGMVALASVWLGLAMAWQMLVANRLETTPTAALGLPVVLILGPVGWIVLVLLARQGEQVAAAAARELEPADRSRAIRHDHDARVHQGGRRRITEIQPSTALFESVTNTGTIPSYVPLPEEFGVTDLSDKLIGDTLSEPAAARPAVSSG